MFDLTDAFGDEEEVEEKGFYHDPDGSKWARREAWIEQRMRDDGDRIAPLGREYFELVYDMEEAPQVTEWELLKAKGFSFPPPESLDDEQLSIKLDELLDELLEMHVEVHFEEGDPERELYTALVTRCLHEPRREVPRRAGSGWHIDLLKYEFDEE